MKTSSYIFNLIEKTRVFPKKNALRKSFVFYIYQRKRVRKDKFPILSVADFSGIPSDADAMPLPAHLLHHPILDEIALTIDGLTTAIAIQITAIRHHIEMPSHAV